MRMAALIKSNFLEALRNPTLLLLPLLTIVMALVFTFFTKSGNAPSGPFLYMCLALGVIMVGSNLPSASFAEDREKRVMEAVLLTPARPLEVILAKLVVSGVITVATGLISILIFPDPPAKPGLLVVAYLLALAFSSAVGTVIGLTSPNQKTAGVIGAPIFMVLWFSAALPLEEFSPKLWQFLAFTPGRPIAELLRAGVEGTTTPLTQGAIVLSLYTVVMIGLCAAILRRLASAR